jgi:hypothetical protein
LAVVSARDAFWNGRRRAARRLVQVAAVAAGVVALRLLLGVWPAAVILATVVLIWFVAGLATLEARVFCHRPAHRRQVPAPSAQLGDHVAFARALTAVARAYLAECERQEAGRWPTR